MKPITLCLIFTLLFLFESCSTFTTIEYPVAPDYKVGSKGRKLVLVEYDGPESISNKVISELESQISQQGWWKFQSLNHQNLELKVTPSGGSIFGNKRSDLTKEDIFIKLHVHEVIADSESYMTKDAHHLTIYGKASMGVTLISGNRQVYMDDKLFNGSSSISDYQSIPKEDKYSIVYTSTSPNFFQKDQVKSQAISKMVKNFLQSITPTLKRTRIQMDDKQKDLKAIFKLIDRKNYEQALSLLEYRSQSQKRSDIFYNIGVLYEQKGEFKKALEMYNNAISFGSPKDYYHQTKKDCEKRKNDYELIKNIL